MAKSIYQRGKGVKQGCPLSPFLFNIVKQDVIRRVKQKIPRLNMVDAGTLKLPDDLLIIAKDQKQLEEIISAIEECLRDVGD